MDENWIKTHTTYEQIMKLSVLKRYISRETSRALYVFNSMIQVTVFYTN